MLKKILLALIVIALFVVGYLWAQAGATQKMNPAEGVSQAPTEVTTIAFGSCNREDRSQGYWETIGSHQADAWLWLGDNVYADTDDPEEMAADYQRLKESPEYAAFTATIPALFGTWDDHDYGKNDAGKEWKMKDEAKELLLDFLDVGADAPVRDRPGVYQAYSIGAGPREIKIILLDTRYFRDPVLESTDPDQRYGPNPDGDVLGEEQWAWLEKELRESTAAAHVVGSSIQVLPTDHPYEKWANFPKARTRLLELLAETQPSLPLLISGDRHLAEFTKDSVGDFTLYELTSSGLTHSYESAKEANDKRVGPLVTEKNFGLLHFVWMEDEVQLLAEVRAIDDNRVLSDLALALDEPMNKDQLTGLVHPKEGMPRQLKPCPDSPNCVSTQSTQPAKKRDPITFTGSSEEARERLKRVIADMARTELLTEEGNYLHYTFKTWPIPFVDDVEFIIDPAAKEIHYRSASRVGHSDLGVNSKRMEKVVQAFGE